MNSAVYPMAIGASTCGEVATRHSESWDAGAPKSLCVDLDGTLIATDVLWESIILLIKQQPASALLIPIWALHGRAHLKRQLATRVRLNAATLPYRPDVVEFVENAQRLGREIVLATGSDAIVANDVAAHLGCFTSVMASNGVTNLSSGSKRDALVGRFGVGGFDYIGDSHADLTSWAAADRAMLVDPSPFLLRRARARATVRHVFAARRRWPTVVLKALRVHQWVKNLLVFVPLIMAHDILAFDKLIAACATFVVFSLLASSIYLTNDLLDLEADRQHPRKKQRPLASGELSIPAGASLALGLGAGAFVVGAVALPVPALACVIAYGVVASAYSYRVKKIVVADVMVLASLYVLRVIAGGLAVAVPLSHWLLGFSMFMFLSLALMKRHAELTLLERDGKADASGRGYLALDREWVGSMGIVSGYLSVLVLALYITSDDVEVLYRWPTVLWPACVAVLLWISRLWALAYRGAIDDDPVVVTLRDPLTYMVGGLIATLIFVAAWM
jgi:4-hydroxybenzoate polyprenyltransferase/phosphoserine phosphatase